MVDLTPGAQWAIETLRAEFPGEFDVAIGYIEREGLANVYKMLSAGHPSGSLIGRLVRDRAALNAAALAILQAALVRDAMAPLEARIAELEARNAVLCSELDELRHSTMALDARTFGMKRYGGLQR